MQRMKMGILLLFLLIVITTQAQTTVSVPIVIDRTNDILVVYVGGNQAISMEDFNIVYERNGETQAAIFLADYPAFQPIDNVTTPICFVMRTFQTISPLPETCATLNDTQIYTYSLSPSGIFWFDRTQNRQRQLLIRTGSEAVQVCQQESIVCEFNFPATAPQELVVPETAEPTCLITDDVNLLTSTDTDGDGLSDFEENCILLTDAETPNRDSDGDGVIDDLELIFAQNNPAWANPSRADTDSDGDWLFDPIEREIDTAIDLLDTDGDTLSDFIEFYWLGTDWQQADRDDNFNGFPDVLEIYLPPSLPEFTPCRAEITATITRVVVVDREEDNDPQEFVVGDEAEVSYSLSDLTGNGGTLQRTWSEEGIETGDEFDNFPALGTMAVACGSAIEFSVSAVESDAPFGGSEDLGEETFVLNIIFHRIPIANNLGTEQVAQFIGTSEDGFYDYQVFYTIEVRLIDA